MMLDLQSILHNHATAARQEELKTLPVLSLGEIIAKLEAVADQNKEVVYDFDGMCPTHLMSWRGIYAELSLGYRLGNAIKVSELLGQCKEAVGKVFEGYKGGDFRMGRGTPVWVANYGESSRESEKYKYVNVAIVGVQDGEKVTLLTQECET
jgi:hypothetical protein